MDAGPATGQQFGAYRLGSLLGRGGMGVVYRAEHETLGRVVALKLLTPGLAENPDFRSRFLRESRMAASLDHPNVVTVYDAGDVGGTLYIAMRFVSGTDLAGLLHERGPLPPYEALAMLEQVASALDAAHALGLVHRDVKPANVLIEGDHCYLTDFGLTKPMAGATALTAAGQFLGTLAYVAPEQIMGDALDSRADVYSLGCVLFECLTGARPYPRPADAAVLYAHLREPPPSARELRPELPAAIDTVIARALAKPPEERYESCGALVADTRTALADADTAPAPSRAATATLPAEPVATQPASASPHVYRRGRGRAGLAAAGAAFLLALVVVVVLISSGGDDEAATTPDRGGSQPRVAGAPIPVGKRPFGVAVAAGSVWVAGNSDGSLTRVSPDGGGTRRISAGRGPFGVAADGDLLWVSNTGDDTLERYDARSGRRTLRLDVGDSPFFVAATPRRAYVTNGNAGTISEFYVDGRPRRAPFPAGPQPRGIAIAGGVAWVAAGDGSVRRIAHGKETRRIEVGERPVGMTAGAGAVWVANKDSDSVSRIDVSDPSNVRTTPVGDQPFGIAYGEGYVWVANSGDDTVMRLDPASGRQVGDPISVPGQPVGVAVGAGSVWVTANDRDALVRIEP